MNSNSCFLSDLAQKYSLENLTREAVEASAAERGLELKVETRMRVKFLRPEAMSVEEIPSELIVRNEVIVIYLAVKDGCDYIIGVPEANPCKDNVFCTSPVQRVTEKDDDSFVVQTVNATWVIKPIVAE